MDTCERVAPWLDVARHGLEGSGMDRCGMAGRWQDRAWVCARSGAARRGRAWCGMTRLDRAWVCAGQGKQRRGMVRRGEAWHGAARRSLAWCGKTGLGYVQGLDVQGRAGRKRAGLGRIGPGGVGLGFEQGAGRMVVSVTRLGKG